MKPASKKQIGYIKGLGKRHGMDYESSDFMDEAGNISISYQEANAMIKKLLGEKDPKDLMRKKIISMAHTMRWNVKGTERADIKRINDWCIKYGQFHKPLNTHTNNELAALTTQFQSVMESYLENIAKQADECIK